MRSNRILSPRSNLKDRFSPKYNFGFELMKLSKNSLKTYTSIFNKLFLLLGNDINFLQLKLSISHESNGRQAYEKHLKGPKPKMRNWRKPVETDVLTTGLIRVAFEISALITVNGPADNGRNEHSECEQHKHPHITQRSTQNSYRIIPKIKNV